MLEAREQGPSCAVVSATHYIDRPRHAYLLVDEVEGSADRLSCVDFEEWQRDNENSRLCSFPLQSASPFARFDARRSQRCSNCCAFSYGKYWNDLLFEKSPQRTRRAGVSTMPPFLGLRRSERPLQDHRALMKTYSN